jgi:hypothetical protein
MAVAENGVGAVGLSAEERIILEQAKEEHAQTTEAAKRALKAGTGGPSLWQAMRACRVTEPGLQEQCMQYLACLQ